MKPPVRCPSCEATNPPDRERCQACGRSLRPADSAGSVNLQRVMGGEVFTAVLDPRPRAPAGAPDEPAVPDTAPPPAPTEEATRGLLADITEHLRERAGGAGRRFKPYAGLPARVPERPADPAAAARHLESAARSFREKAYGDAVEHLLLAIAKDDRDARSWTLLGEAYLRMDRPFKAAVGYLRALDLDAGNATAWFGISRVLRAVGDPADARAALERTIEINPNLAEAWAERGEVLEALNNPSEAARSFARTLELRPDHATARERLQRLAPQRFADTAASEAEPVPPAEAEDDLPDFTDLAELPAKESAARPASPSAPQRPARVKTYVDGLDETIAGGVPWGHVVLLEGSPGTMKSSLGCSILLHHAARDGRHGLYLSLEERTSSLLKQMGSLGFHLHVNRGSMVVLDPRAARGLLEARPDWVEAFQSAIASVRDQRGLDLLVIDSLEALEVLARFKDRRREIFRLFEWLRDLGVTSFVITERPDWVVGGHVIQGRWDEDFLADGVIHLRQHLVSDLEVQRRLRIVKMRGTRHDTGYLALVLDDGRFKVTRAMSP